ncbi:DUF4390 domain-containing protein [Pandoraea apista]|uniref:Uncharacterized protein n=1 Tax=Pandoraea apista TaxID=93218 RepID=A0A0G4JEZ4_9BURK|nr:DUF4390 domain-containing protein [Pandoraea apista]RRW95422.1 DUF4390 domain-containing protein [Pandoraea apista]RRX04465.1 DUF4390 domain-containing protein [Pandoraea apista]CFB61999.1 hypothetical protein LMG16407_02068 [Pandoraea apista]VVG69482.1 hypothetical protein PAP18089_00437 [Pandoraea apista]
MTFSQRLLASLLPLLLCVFALGFAAPARAENEIQVREARLEPSEGGWSLDARFAFELNSSLEDAVNRGISLYFTTDFELTRSRWYWFDEKVVSTSQSVRLWFQPLTRQYRVSSNNGNNNSGGLQLGFTSLRDALALVRNVSGWRVIDKGVAKPGTQYQASVRMRLDNALMPKPFQIDAVNNRDWNLSSEWARFMFSPTSPPAAASLSASPVVATSSVAPGASGAAAAAPASTPASAGITGLAVAASGTLGTANTSPRLTGNLPLAFSAALPPGAARVK